MEKECTVHFSSLFNMITLGFPGPRIGNTYYSFHTLLTKEQIVFPPRLLNKDTRSIIDKISKADRNHTVAANFVFHKTDIMLLKHSIVYLSGHCNQLKKFDEIKEQNSTEKIINYLKGKKFNHMVLYHNRNYNQIMNNCQSDSRMQ